MIQFLCHSHGGNVLAEAVLYAKAQKDPDFIINNVIFFETPIYQVTEKAIDACNEGNDYYIKDAYNFVVANDKIQIIDFITGHFPFNKRYFENKREGVNQYKINDSSAGHNSFASLFEDVFKIVNGD